MFEECPACGKGELSPEIKDWNHYKDIGWVECFFHRCSYCDSEIALPENAKKNKEYMIEKLEALKNEKS